VSPLGLMAPDDLRRSLRELLLGGGLPPQHVDEIADLATLAVVEALASIDRVGARASSQPAQMAIVSAALSAAAAVIDLNLQALASFGRSQGTRVVETTASMGLGKS